MPPMLLFAAATGITVPSIIDRLSPDDYPTWAIKQDLSGGAVIDVKIDPKGKVVSCEVAVPIGDKRFGPAVCAILSRKRYPAATFRDGQKAYAVLRTMVNLWLPDTTEGKKVSAMRLTPENAIEVSRLPKGESADVGIFLAFDSQGKIIDCLPADPQKSPTLGSLACDHRAIFDNVVQTDVSGQPVAYVTRKAIRFEVAQPAK